MKTLTEQELEQEKRLIKQKYKELLEVTYQTIDDEGKKMIRKAFDLAVEAHKDQRRKSGEAYIFHPIAVAKIVAKEIGLGATAISAALLHDVVEDTDYTVEDMARIFNPKIAQIVKGLTKISKIDTDQDISLQAENYRKMLLTLNEDVRVILVKIADRLHNMQTMESMPAYKQAKIGAETLYIYAPLAHRLGLFNIKTKLEDLGLKYTQPDEYNEILMKIKESKEEQNAYIAKISDILRKDLEKEDFDFIIKGRPKSVFSIYRKMQNQGVKFEEVYDKFALRIIYESEPENEKFLAWKIYSIVTNHFNPSPSRLRDWISSPKSTGYEALHTTVMGPEGRWVEIQIRSERMDEIAEKGYAAHYKYKQGESKENSLDRWLNLLKETLENPAINAVDFVEDFKLNLYSKEIYVFTPKGDIKSLPKGATALDFAFSIHTKVGEKTKGAKVNGKLTPINHELNSGDQVEIITSQNQKPTIHWLDFVTTARAKNKIKSILNEEMKLVAEEGKEILLRKLRHHKLTMNDKLLGEMQQYFSLKTSQDLLYRIGANKLDSKAIKEFIEYKNSNQLVNFIKKAIRKENKQYEEEPKKLNLVVFGKDEERLDYKIAQCCQPLPGEDIFGFITINEGIKVHKKTCPNAIKLQSNYAYRIMQAKWIDSSLKEYHAKIDIRGLDELGLTNKLTKIISNQMNVNIQSIALRSDNGIFTGEIVVIVPNINIVNDLIQNIKKIDGIEKITRTIN